MWICSSKSEAVWDKERIRQYLEIGVGRVILGTVAVKDPEFLEEMVAKYGDRIAVGVDSKDGYVHNGSRGDRQRKLRVLQISAEDGVKTVIYTDISRDGSLEGADLEAYRKLTKIENLDIVASGGISFYKEIEQLRDVVFGSDPRQGDIQRQAGSGKGSGTY
ncbi:MAG: HisA/HisF-related TIM barrel protein [Clostridia bacterium]